VGTSIDAPSSVACDVKSFAMWTWIKAYQSSKINIDGLTGWFKHFDTFGMSIETY
jgi:hypothetical protein